ncbi:DUF4369 domain-containing protein [Flavobacterium sp.]|uniref:DUF4369 domain-containing protein n=1 Tax=Flavobacterium sp. TaxID=239 RepID=UPI0039E2B1C5
MRKKESDKNLHITGNVKGLKKGTLYIQKVVDTNLVAIDTIHINGDSHFSSDFNIDSPEMYYLFLDRGVTNSLDNNLPFFVEPGNIHIETKLDLFLSGAKITGSKNNDKYYEFRQAKTRFTDYNLGLMEQKLNAFKNNNTTRIDSLEKLAQANTKRFYLYTTNFAVNHKDFEVAPFLALSEIPDINLHFLDTIQKSMSPKVAQSLYGKKLTQYYNDRKKSEKQ